MWIKDANFMRKRREAAPDLHCRTHRIRNISNDDELDDGFVQQNTKGGLSRKAKKQDRQMTILF